MVPRTRLLLPVLLALPLLAAGDDPLEARFQAFAPECAKICAPCLDDVLVVPGFDPKCGSSRGRTGEEVRRKLAVAAVQHPKGGDPVRGTLEAPKEELRAADALPSLDQGDYGWLASAEVVKVLGPQDMVVTKLRLVDLKEARAAAADALRKAQADLDREKTAVVRALEARIEAEEREKKSLEAWRGVEQNVGRTSGQGTTRTTGTTRTGTIANNGQGGAIKAKLDETTRRLKKLEEEKSEVARNYQSDRTELARVSKEHLEARTAADKAQSKIRKDLDGTFRLTGFDTAKVRAGGTFAGADGDGFQVAVAWTDADGRRVLAATDLLKKPATAAGLRGLLAKRKSSVAAFVETMAKARQGKSGDAAAAAMRQAMAAWMRPEPESADPKGKKRKTVD